jgi:hypothetical protein
MVRDDDRCPFLVPVVADHLHLYPVPAYCHRPDAPVRVPALETFLGVCLGPEHVDCPGFRTTVSRGSVAAG